MPSYNVLLVMVNSAWEYVELQKTLDRIKEYYKPYATLHFYIRYQNNQAIKWIDQTFTTNFWVRTDKHIDATFYDNTFVKPSLKYTWDLNIPVDIHAVVLPENLVRTATTRGACDWGNSNAGMVECWIAGDTKDMYRFNGEPVISGLEANLAHEICHAIKFYNGQRDDTHDLMLREKGNLPSPLCLSTIKATPLYYANKSGFRTIRNWMRRVWNLF